MRFLGYLGYGVEPEHCRMVTKMVEDVLKYYHKYNAERGRRCSQNEGGWVQDGAEMVPNDHQNGAKIDPESSWDPKVDPRVEKTIFGWILDAFGDPFGEPFSAQNTIFENKRAL